MERLTVKGDDGVKIMLPGLQLPYSIYEISDHYRGMLDEIAGRLATYEDLGTLEELARLKAAEKYKKWNVIVNCRDCKSCCPNMVDLSGAKTPEQKDAWSCFDGFCSRYLKRFEPSDFCSYGERRDEADSE